MGQQLRQQMTELTLLIRGELAPLEGWMGVGLGIVGHLASPVAPGIGWFVPV